MIKLFLVLMVVMMFPLSAMAVEDETAVETSVSEATVESTEETGMESMEEDETAVEDTEIDGETLVSDEPLETIASDSDIDVSAIAEVLSLQANAYDGSISTTYTTYFSGVVDKLGIEDYVLIRSGQYEYLFVYGDLELSGTTFTGAGTIMTINTFQHTTIGIETDDNITINVGSYMAYSNLGSYPALAVGVTKAQYYELLWLIIVIALTVYISTWFGYGLGGWRVWKKDILR